MYITNYFQLKNVTISVKSPNMYLKSRHKNYE